MRSIERFGLLFDASGKAHALGFAKMCIGEKKHWCWFFVLCLPAVGFTFFFGGRKPDTDKNGHMRSSSVADDVEFGVGKETGLHMEGAHQHERFFATCETNPAIICLGEFQTLVLYSGNCCNLAS